MDEILIIEPPQVLAICPPITWQHRNIPLILTFIIVSHEDSGYISNGPVSFSSASGGASIAALFIKISTLPKLDKTTFSPLSIDFRLVISVLIKRSFFELISLSLPFVLFNFISKAATAAPALRSVRTYSPPSWPAAPVTIAVLPDKLKNLSLLYLGFIFFFNIFIILYFFSRISCYFLYLL